MTEHRYRAVLQVLDGVPKSQVAREFATPRQSVHAWVARYQVGGLAGLADGSRRPHTSPNAFAPDVMTMMCELRRIYPRWGAQRIAHVIGLRCRGLTLTFERAPDPGAPRPGSCPATESQTQVPCWPRDAPMQLWQLDIMGGVFLADGRECNLVTGIDDHSRFMEIATVVTEPWARAVCEAFSAALIHHGVPSEVLTDNGKQFTGRSTKPYPAEVLFERICRENGITTRLTNPRSPTTTGKIERWHKTLRRELLDAAGPFPDVETAQALIDAWVNGYNHARPHQSLAMDTPASPFRPARIEPIAAAPSPVHPPTSSVIDVVVPPELAPVLAVRSDILVDNDIHAVEWETDLTPVRDCCCPASTDEVPQPSRGVPSPSGPVIAAFASCLRVR